MLSLPGAIAPEDADKADADGARTSISPSGRPSLGARRGSVSDRASALKMNAPLRRWSRTTNAERRKGAGQSKPSGGLRLTVTTCKFGRKCTRKDCWFTHTNGRIIDDGRTSLTDEEELCVPCGDADSLDVSKVASLGKASLRLLVKAIVADTGKCGYLHVRNCLQRGEYVGRALTRDEKNTVGEILEELEGGSTAAASTKTAATATARGTGRSSFSNSRLNRSSFTGGRVSLSDMCRDPSLHSRLSAANTARA